MTRCLSVYKCKELSLLSTLYVVVVLVRAINMVKVGDFLNTCLGYA